MGRCAGWSVLWITHKKRETTMPYKKLKKGFYAFRDAYFLSGKNDLYKRLVKEGQKPETLVIACSDSRIDPAILTQSDPGDFFAVRNVAALVPPYRCGGLLRGTSSAIEYAVRFLGISNIIILGHTGCGGVNALASNTYKAVDDQDFEFLRHWLNIGQEARNAVFETLVQASPEEKIRALEQAVILVSMSNLMSFPWIKERCSAGLLQIHGWHFDMAEGRILEYDPEKALFLDIDPDAAPTPLLAEQMSLVGFLRNCAKACSHS